MMKLIYTMNKKMVKCLQTAIINLKEQRIYKNNQSEK